MESSQRSVGVFSDNFDGKSDLINIMNSERNNAISECPRFSDRNNLLKDFKKDVNQLKSASNFRSDGQKRNLQFTGLGKDKKQPENIGLGVHKPENYGSNPRFE